MGIIRARELKAAFVFFLNKPSGPFRKLNLCFHVIPLQWNKAWYTPTVFRSNLYILLIAFHIAFLNWPSVTTSMQSVCVVNFSRLFILLLTISHSVIYQGCKIHHNYTAFGNLAYLIMLPLVYKSCPSRAEPNIVKFGDSMANIKLNRFLPNLGWGQIDTHCWSNNVGWQKLNHLTSHLNNVEKCGSTWSHKICILVSVKHFRPINVCVMMFTETDLSQTSNSSRSWTQEAVNMAVPCWKLLWGWYISGFKLMEDQEWAKINVKSTRDVWFTQLFTSIWKTSLKSEKKYKNHKQAEYHHTLKRKKNSVKCHARDSNLEPLVYEASVLPTELSFRMKNWEKTMTIYIWFVVQQM